MPQYRRPPKKKPASNSWVVIISLIMATVVLFSLFNTLGSFGGIIRNISFGLFGLSAYAYSVITILICVRKLIDHRLVVDKVIALKYLPLLILGILVIHTITTKNYVAIDYTDYLAQCYSNGISNAGGIIFGLLVYPLSKLGFNFALSIFVVAFFSVAFISLYPLFLSNDNFKTKNVKYTKSNIKALRNDSRDIEVGNELFIGTPDGRSRNNKILRKSAFSSSKSREFDIMFPNKQDYDSITQEDNKLIKKIKNKGSYDILFSSPENEQENDQEFRVEKKIVDLPQENKPESLIFPTISNSIDNDSKIKESTKPKPVVSAKDEYANYTLGYRQAQIKKSLDEGVEIQTYNKGKRLGIFDKEKVDEIENSTSKRKDKSMSQEEQERFERAKNRLYGDQEIINTDSDRTFDSLFVNDKTHSLPYNSIMNDVSNNTSESNDYGKFNYNENDKESSDEDLFDDLPKFVLQDISRRSNNSDIQDDDGNKFNSNNNDNFDDNLFSSQPNKAPARAFRSDIGKSHNVQPKKINNFMDSKIDAKQVALVDSPTAVYKRTRYKAPPEELLKTYPKVESNSIDEHKERCMALRNVLLEYGIDTLVDRYTVGPSFTRYEITMPTGVTVKKVQQLSDDIAMRLKANKIRIEAPIPGKNAVGVEIGNSVSSIVGVREGIRSHEFKKDTELSFLLGVNISGEVFACNIAKMPHLLIAGATGSGKSVCINTLICSLMYKYSPDQVRLILVDPKRVELSLYNDLPHLLIPEVIYEAEKSINALNWATKEMERRYELFHKMRVRNLEEHNQKANNEGMPILPYIVFVIDELADLMTYKKKDIEEKIKRLAQLARAAGIHLIFATQRPSVDIITGTIKANFPSRIAFAVTSFADSKTILDHGGADKLRGQGDMLYAPSGAPDPIRLQGAFISNKEVEAITDYIRENNQSYFDESIEAEINDVKSNKADDNNSEEYNNNSSDDEIFEPALKLIIESEQASISMIQRRFAVGYARAARLIDEMELKNFIGPSEGSKPRDVKITMDEYKALYGTGEDK